MAGRKQHFIPQALQRGFGIAKAKKTQVFVFKKGLKPYLSSTEGVAAQRDFYSEPSDQQSLDDKITAYESAVLAPAIVALRQAPAGPVDSHVAAAVVVHLSIRSGFTRGSFSAAAVEILERFSGAMNSEKSARPLLDIDSPQSESMLLKLIEEEIFSQFGSIPESGRNALAKLAHFRAREKFSQMFPGLVAMVLQQFSMLTGKMPEIVANAHSKALDGDMAPTLRVERLKAMNWKIVAAEKPAHFVLPDCLAVGAKTADFQEMLPYSLLDDDELAGVVMPICSEKVLVGSFGSTEIDFVSLNRAFAECSLDFFISSQADENTIEIAQYLGTTVSKYIDILAQDQTFDAPASSETNEDPPLKSEQPLELAELPITFEPTSRKDRKAQTTLNQLLNNPELQPGLLIVDAIVISDSVPDSLRERGVVLNGYAAQAQSLGTCYVTETPQGLSCQLFVTTEAVNLVAEGHPLSRAAAGLIRHQAGRATYYATVLSKIPIEALQRPKPLLETVGLRIAHLYCSHYFGSRLSGMGNVSDMEFESPRVS